MISLLLLDQQLKLKGLKGCILLTHLASLPVGDSACPNIFDRAWWSVNASNWAPGVMEKEYFAVVDFINYCSNTALIA